MSHQSQSLLARLASGAPASAIEARAALRFGLAGVVLAILCAQFAGPDLAWWQWLILLIIAFDLVGGVAANATLASTRQYHRENQPYRPLLFAAAHIQPFVLALVLPAAGWLQALALWLAGLAGVLGTVLAPSPIKRAFALGYCALTMSLFAALGQPDGLAWLAPAFLLKLVAAHAVPMWSMETRRSK